MLTVKVNEIVNYAGTNFKDKLVQVHVITAENYDTVFRRMYAFCRSARYDNARRYEFEDSSLKSKYKEWKQKNETISLFYGNGTVD